MDGENYKQLATFDIIGALHGPQHGCTKKNYKIFQNSYIKEGL
jgi:hypothetical protein